MYLLNANNMGGYTPGGPDNVVGQANIGGCWCAPSNFLGTDGIGRIVSSGGGAAGDAVIVWKLIKPLRRHNSSKRALRK
jgi:hypothetical protein